MDGWYRRVRGWLVRLDAHAPFDTLTSLHTPTPFTTTWTFNPVSSWYPRSMFRSLKLCFHNDSLYHRPNFHSIQGECPVQTERGVPLDEPLGNLFHRLNTFREVLCCDSYGAPDSGAFRLTRNFLSLHRLFVQRFMGDMGTLLIMSGRIQI